MSSKPWTYSATEIVEHIKKQNLSAVEVLETHLDRISATNTVINVGQSSYADYSGSIRKMKITGSLDSFGGAITITGSVEPVLLEELIITDNLSSGVSFHYGSRATLKNLLISDNISSTGGGINLGNGNILV